MPADVTQALLEIFMKKGAMDAAAAAEFLKTLERTRHFQSEIWAWLKRERKHQDENQNVSLASLNFIFI